MQVAGWIPRRVLPTGLDTVPGRLRTFDWNEPIEFEALPMARLVCALACWPMLETFIITGT